MVMVICLYISINFLLLLLVLLKSCVHIAPFSCVDLVPSEPFSFTAVFTSRIFILKMPFNQLACHSQFNISHGLFSIYSVLTLCSIVQHKGQKSPCS